MLREPFLHFALLGIVIFVWFTLSNPPVSDADHASTILVDERDIQILTSQFQATWNRPPTAKERMALVDGLVREEILVREARALGLERGDAVIRQRLFQKMMFLTTSAAQSMTPDDTVLEAYLQDNPESFVQQPKIAFGQVFLGAEPTDQDIANTIASFNDGENPLDSGISSLLPRTIPLSVASSVDSTFGRGFFQAVFDSTGPGWGNPIRSAYGVHLVRVTDRQDAALPPFDSVRDKVLWQWRSEKSDELSDAQFELLKAGYRLDLPDLGEEHGGDDQ